MVKSDLRRRDEGNLPRLLSGDEGDFEAAVERSWHGPNGLRLRYTYILELFAMRVFGGDYQRAAKVIEQDFQQLERQSPRVACQTDAGMLGVRRIVAEIEFRRQSGNGMFGAFTCGWEQQWIQDCVMVLDLLPIAWGLHKDEFEQLLGTGTWIETWRNGKVPRGDDLKKRVRRLRCFHEALRLVAQPKEYPSLWRQVWPKHSPIGERSLLQAFEEDGDAALDRLENFFWIYASSNAAE